MDEAPKIGRPTLAADERRDDRLPGIRVTAAERHHVELLAERAGVSVAEFCRRAVLGQRMPQRRAQADAVALVELNRAGVNLNQIAKRVNAGRDLPPDFPQVLAEVRSAVAKVAGDGS
ncbi:plasmid mobilization protein [Mesorhizobium australicum]|uniref:Mobilisation protein (MobC) n=1 Tax=Mesorhizobium australicum TaxID=536018 RepID=A0A1X7MQ01_9HYPH|nr:plasmid mobilization relaxosome protein MobC [Mesorhizobium australicum]SMH26053.1 mobilisation protein (MobC) [Mesorhizobium australicum]SMH26078.1 mobilisation protein (MobC) [Mesorhizobium australicum]